jgi:hypothetical protein
VLLCWTRAGRQKVSGDTAGVFTTCGNGCCEQIKAQEGRSMATERCVLPCHKFRSDMTNACRIRGIQPANACAKKADFNPKNPTTTSL